MFNNDANDSRAQADAAKKRQESDDFFRGILWEINEESKAGSYRASVRIPERHKEDQDDIVNALREKEYVVEVDGDRLRISWAPRDDE